MNTFTKKKIHAEVLEMIADFTERIDRDLDEDFDYHKDRLENIENKESYDYKNTKERIEEINEKSKFLTEILEHLEKIKL